jgi:L-lactate dehydrogenase
MIQRRTVGIVGTGNVGVAAAYALFNQRLASEIILLDKEKDRAKGEAMDLMHGQLLVGNVNIRAGDYDDLSNAQVVIIAAGISQSSPEDNRLNLLNQNIQVFRDIIAKLDAHAPNAILVIATNPVDILTHAAQKVSSRPASKVIGTGTLLDTARFRSLLGKYYGVDPRSVHAYILGEHGDSEVPIWSQATIGGTSIKNATILGKSFDKERMDRIFQQTKNAAYKIIELKGHTDTAIGVVIARIVKAVMEDEKSVLPVSVNTKGSYGIDDICISLPCSIDLNGVKGYILPDITSREKEALQHSAQVLKDQVDKLDEL